MEQANTDVRKPKVEPITPYKIAIVLLVRDWGLSRSQLNIHTPNSETKQTPYSECEERELMFALLKMLQNADQELRDLFINLQSVLKPQHLCLYMEKLSKFFLGDINSMMEVMVTLYMELMGDVRPPISKNSILGLFIRRMILAYETLSFSQLTQLHRDCTLYYRKAAAYITSTLKQASILRLQTESANTSLDGDDDFSLSLTELMTSHSKLKAHHTPNTAPRIRFADEHDFQIEPDQPHYSTRQAELFIAQQVSLLQYNELEALTPVQLQDKLSQLLTNMPSLAEAHFLSYMNSLRVSEYCGAVDNLYSYFDHHTISQVVHILDSNTPGNIDPNKPQGELVIKGKGYRYAALNLAMLHAKFGHYKEALIAVHECIRMAQDSVDDICLQHALSWLYRLSLQCSDDDLPVDANYLLERLVINSSTLEMTYISSISVLMYAQHCATNIHSSPHTVLSLLAQADHVNIQNFYSTLNATSHAHKAAVWHYYGKTEMCNLNTQLVLNLGPSDTGVYQNNEAECLTLCHLAALHHQQGDYTISMEIMSEVKRRFPPSSSHHELWLLQNYKLAFERALLNYRLSEAQSAVNALEGIDRNEAHMCYIRLLKEKGDFEKALKLIEELIPKKQDGKSNTTVAWQEITREKSEKPGPASILHIYLLQAELYICTSQYSHATQPLLTAISNANKSYRSHIHDMAIVQLAFVQLCLGLPHQALHLLHTVLVSVLSTNNIYNVARTKYLLVKCRIAATNTQPEHRNTRLTVLQQCATDMNEVIALFQKVEAQHKVKDCYYFQALLFNQVGNRIERNKCALQFKQIDEHLKTWNSHFVVP